MKLKGILFVAIFGIITACSGSGGDGSKSGPDYEIRNTKAYNSGPAILFGDSIARGEGASSDQHSLVGCLTTLNPRVINYGQDGATSSDSLNLLQLAETDRASIVVISLGGNDAIVDAFNGNFPNSTTLENIRKIFKTFTDSGSLVIHLGLNPPENPNFPIDTSRLQEIRKIAVETGVLFLDNSFKGMWGNTDFMADDVHPNDKGYELLCDRVKKALDPHLK